MTRRVALAFGLAWILTLVAGAMLVASIARANEHEGSSSSRSGEASWYCSSTSPCTVGYPAGSMAAAAGRELRVGDWRGSWVTVRYGDKSVRVRLVDTCGCPGRRIIDLYRKPFSKLADPSVGWIEVEVDTSGPSPTLPPTDTAP